MKEPTAIHMGDRGGVLMCVELPNGRRVLQGGGVDVLDADQARHLRRELDRVLPWLDGTNVSRATMDPWERKRGGVEIGERREA